MIKKKVALIILIKLHYKVLSCGTKRISDSDFFVDRKKHIYIYVYIFFV